MSKTIVLLHATQVAMQPVSTAMAELWPEATPINLLDDGLSIERAKDVELTEALTARFIRFGEYARDMGVDGILATCSAFGEALEKLADKLDIPVLKPNEAMFASALTAGSRIGMIATFQPAIAGMEKEFYNMVAKMNKTVTLNSICATGAIEQLKAGNNIAHNQIVAQYAEQLADCDAIMLAHFSTSCALNSVQAVTAVPVLAAPHAAVTEMKKRVMQQEGYTTC